MLEPHPDSHKVFTGFGFADGYSVSGKHCPLVQFELRRPPRPGGVAQAYTDESTYRHSLPESKP